MFKNCSRAYERLATNDQSDAKKGFAEKALIPTVLKIEKNNQDQKHVKSAGLQDCYHRFFYFLLFDPQNVSVLLKILPLKYQKFSNFRKNRIYVIVLLVCYRHAKSELDNSIFGKVMAKKNCSKLMTSNILTLLCAVVDHV